MNDSLDRGMPASPDAERSILGAILLDNEAFYQASAALSPEDFSLDSHRRIFLRMLELTTDGKPIDLVTMTEELQKHKELDAVGGAAYFMSLTDGLPYRPSIEHYCKIVRDKSKLRQAIHVFNGGTARALEQQDTADEVIGGANSQLLSIYGDADGEIKHVSEFSDATWGKLEERERRNSDVIGLPTGVLAVDEATGGICESEYWVIGARPGDGKTSFAVQATEDNASKELPVGVFSIEMRNDQFLQRVWVKRSGIPSWKVRKPFYMKSDEKKQLLAAAMEVRGWPIYVSDASGVTIEQLMARAVLMVKRHKVGLIVVDYLQEVQAKGRDEIERVQAVSRGLRRLAKDYCPVFCLSQLARPTEHNIRKRPNMTELKGSSQIEQDAHTILLLYRGRDEQNQYTDESEVIIEKQREGKKGLIPVRYDEDSLSFEGRPLS